MTVPNIPYSITRIAHGNALKKSDLNEMWLCRITMGEAVVSFNLREYSVRKDDAFAIMEGDLFLIVSSSEEMEMEVMVLQNSFLNVVYPFLGPDVNWSLLDSSLHLLRQMNNPYNELLMHDYEALRCMLSHQEILTDNKLMLSMTAHFLMIYYKAVMESHPTESTSEVSRSYQLLTQFYALISEQSPVTQRNLDYYADRLHITVRHLFKVCKSETGMTPKEIIDDFVVGDIKNTLLTTNLNFQQVAERFAFPDQSAFGQYFRRHTGLSLSEFRKNRFL